MPLSMLLPENDVISLNEIQQAVRTHAAYERLVALVEQVARTVQDRTFPQIYTGILLAAHDRIAEAVECLEVVDQNVLCQHLVRYLKAQGAFAPVARAFEDPRPYEVFCQTEIYQSYLRETARAIVAFLEDRPPRVERGEVAIVDVGTGNGVLLAQTVNALLQQHKIQQLHLVLIDQSPQMLEAAQQHCIDTIDAELSFTLHCARIEELADDVWAQLRAAEPWFVNGALSLHHMPREHKIPTLKKLRSIAPYCLISDLHANHDAPEQYSPELLYSIVESYRPCMENILHAPGSHEDQLLCIDHFWMVELITMIREPRASRIDYHTTIEHWEALAREAGWTPMPYTATYSLPDRPVFFTLPLI